MHRQRHARIVAALGPAGSDLDTVRALFATGTGHLADEATIEASMAVVTGQGRTAT